MEYIINNKPVKIQYQIKNRISDNLSKVLGKDYAEKKALIITDENVDKLHCDKIEAQLKDIFSDTCKLVLPAGEAAKSLDSLLKIYQALQDNKLTRSDYIIALGGGTIGDVCGFAASTYMRGIHIIAIPTTLLAQVDSCVGGKTAINLNDNKNNIGSFYHPTMIFIDPCLLVTLPDKYIKDATAEILKYGFICDKQLFDTMYANDFSALKAEIKLNYDNAHANVDIQESFKKANRNNEFLINNIIRRCIRSKIDFVSNDPLDNGARLKLNFGHTLGHAIESLGNFEKYSHGEGVALGMYMITKLSEEKGLTKSGCAALVKEILDKYELPYECEFTLEELKDKVFYDKKKRGNVMKYVVLDKIGYAYIHDADIDFLS